MVDAPLTAFWHWHFTSRFTSVRSFCGVVGDRTVVRSDYAWHAALHAVLHMTNVALLWVLLGRFVPAFWPRVLGSPGLRSAAKQSERCFGCPIVSTCWPSRFVGRAACCVVAQSPSGWPSFLASLAACWSKEWALVACLVAALLMMVGARSRVLPARPMMAAGMLLAKVGWIGRGRVALDL